MRYKTMGHLIDALFYEADFIFEHYPDFDTMPDYLHDLLDALIEAHCQTRRGKK